MKSPLRIYFTTLLVMGVAQMAQVMGAPVELNSRAIRVIIDPGAKGAIASVVDKASGMEFVANPHV
jgi:hypothetical protein